MRYILFFLLGLGFFSSCDNASLVGPFTKSISDSEVVAGLKQALEVGTDTTVNVTSKINGYFKNQFIKIILPPEAQKVESTLRSIGLGSMVDNAILSLNRAAEDAAISAKPIFINAITSITITDGKNILFGDSTAATAYLKGKTFTDLQNTYKPIVSKSLDKVNATKYWGDVFNTYNQIPGVNKVNPDLTDYTTGKALDGLFYMVGKKEKDIRRDPVARVTDLLKEVFGQLVK